jgi:hypothetical protein
MYGADRFGEWRITARIVGGRQAIAEMRGGLFSSAANARSTGIKVRAVIFGSGRTKEFI